MKKRLRKKLHRGEFQEFGFPISWQFTPTLTDAENDLFFGELIDWVEAAGLTFGGGGGPEGGSGFVCRAKRTSASEEDRAQMANWLHAFSPALAALAGPLEDAWHTAPPQFSSAKDWTSREDGVVIIPPVRN